MDGGGSISAFGCPVCCPPSTPHRRLILSAVTRIFSVLAWFAVLCVAANALVGLSMGDLNVATGRPEAATIAWARLHRLFGVGAALAVVFVNSVVVTYFVGTSRWVKEVSETYRLEPDLVVRSNRLKRRAFPWCVLAMLTAVGIVALGGAADPGTGLRGTAQWVTPHLVGAISGLAVIVLAAVVEWNQLHAHHQVIDEVGARVRRIRLERGLEVE